MTPYFHYDPRTGEIIGTGITPDGTYPPNTIQCSEQQAAEWQHWFVVVGGKKPVLKRKENK